MTIASRIESIRLTLPPSTRLIAVSKQVSSDYIRQAYRAGVRDFAESKLQEAISKQQELKDLPDISWHFIGHLQANKALFLEKSVYSGGASVSNPHYCS